MAKSVRLSETRIGELRRGSRRNGTTGAETVIYTLGERTRMAIRNNEADHDQPRQLAFSFGAQDTR